jgi:hypothetical protein
MTRSSPAFLGILLASASMSLSAGTAIPEDAAHPVLPTQATSAEKKSVDAAKPPIALTPMEIAEMEKRVRQRCGVLDEMSGAHLPWYYHYVLGLELQRAGDDAHALECLKEAVSRRPEPKVGARIYGLWFLDYTPYSVLADLNDRLGNSECAADARRLAETLEPQPKRPPKSRSE